LQSILANRTKVFSIIREELTAIRDKYGDARRTQIIADVEELDIEDLIADEDMVITITNSGYIKRLPPSTYRQQHRGGKGVTGMTTKEDDFVKHIFIASTHDYLLVFTEEGMMFWLKVHDIPEAGRVAKGKSVVNILQLKDTQRIAAIIQTKDFDPDHFLIMATENGIVKKTSLDAFKNPRKNGIIAMGVKQGDRLIKVKMSTGKNKIILGTFDGKSLCFKEENVRNMGRTASGVTGMRMSKGDKIVGMEVLEEGATILTVCENGHGKRTDFKEYRVQGRGGKGIINIKTTARNGKVVGFMGVSDHHDVIVSTLKGMIVRMSIKDLRTIGRNTQGVRLVSLKNGDKVVSVARIDKRSEEG
ncbi:DNA gyrase subunit A, partial [PVC group bacterium]|nr:DNA gyrase subunit A [PVC group bacterium]